MTQYTRRRKEMYLKENMEKLGITGYELGGLLGKPSGVIYKYYRNESQPNITTASLIADYCRRKTGNDYSIEDLFYSTL